MTALEQAYFVAEICASVLLIASLLFVGYQILQSQKIERATAQRDLLFRIADWDYQSHANPEMRDAIILAMDEYETAPIEVQQWFEKYAFGLLTIVEAALSMRKDGFFTDGTWAGIEGAGIALLKTRGGAQYWPHARKFFGFEIAQHLDRRLEEVGDDFPGLDEFLPSQKRRLKQLRSEQRQAATP